MSDESKAERLHLEGLDEATERERWEEHHASDDEAAIARLLAEHVIHHSDSSKGYGHWVTCQCGWQTKPCKSESLLSVAEQHRAHVAAVIAAHMADREADAWDAGFDQGETHTLTIPFAARPPNPFRLTPDTEGETDE